MVAVLAVSLPVARFRRVLPCALSSSSSFSSSCSISRVIFSLLVPNIMRRKLGDDQLQVFDLAVAAEQLLLLGKDKGCERLSI